MKTDSKMGNRKLVLLSVSFFFLILISFNSISAQSDDILSYKQNSIIDIKVSCSNIDCSSPSGARITIEDPETNTLVDNESMSIQDSYANYTFNQTKELGVYNYYVRSEAGTPEYYEDDFRITPSGESGTDNIVFHVFVIVFLVGLNLLAFFNKNIPLTVLTGMAVMFLGVYLINNGIIIFRDEITNYVSYLITGVGAITSFWALFEQFDII